MKQLLLSLNLVTTMKTFLTVVIMALTAMLSLNAKSISPAEAADLAADFFNAPISGSPMKAPQAQGALSPYYVFNHPEKKGWVIVSGDDGMRRILAYGEGSFDTDNAPEGAKELLDSYAMQYAIASSGQHLAPSYAEIGNEVLLETPKWDQFSSLTPVIDGYNTPVGCVPTAMGIICRYHEWPIRGIGAHSYTTPTHNIDMSADFDTDYHISSLPMDPYSAGTWTAEQTYYQNQLLLHLGIAAETDYDRGGSSAGCDGASRALTKHFGYMPTAQIHLGLTSLDDAHEIIKADIDDRLPLLVSGANGSVGHMFVCDGYNSSGMLHFNFGWGGICDGYYSIDDMGGFHYSPDFYCHIRPNKDFLTSESPDWVMGVNYLYGHAKGGLFPTVEYPISAGDHVYVHAFQLTPLQPFYGEIAVVLCDESGTMKTFLAKNEKNWPTPGTYISDYRIDFVIPDNIDLHPSDRIYLYTSTDSINWKRVPTYDGENEYIEIRMQPKPLSISANISPNIEADLKEIFSSGLNPYTKAVVSATLPETDGGVVRLIVNGQRCYPDSVVGLTSFFSIVPASYYDDLDIRIDTGSHAALILRQSLTADSILSPGCTTDINVESLYYYYYSYTEIFDKANSMAIALCDAAGRILQLYDPVDFRDGQHVWTDVHIPADTPNDAYVCLMSSFNHDDWKEVYSTDQVYVRIPMGYDSSAVRFTLRYICEAMNRPFYEEEHYWGEKIDPCRRYPYDTQYEFLGWEGVPETMPGHDVDVYARISYRVSNIQDIVDQPATATDDNFYDISGRKINTCHTPNGSIIINKGKKWVHRR